MSEGRGLSGHLELTSDLDARGLTRLRHQSFRAPVHLSKPYHEAGTLVVNVVNPTAGMLENDRLRVDVRLESGARLLLTSPSANRIHTMRTGCAQVTASFRLEAGSFLDWWPEVLIPQAGARYQQKTSLELDAEAELLFFESFAPGRTAMGEVFAYSELRWSTDLRVAGTLLARERWVLQAGNEALRALRRRFAQAYVASAFLASPLFHPESSCWNALHALHGEKVWSGVSALNQRVFVWKVIAADSVTLRQTLQAGRGVIYAALQRPLPLLRRGEHQGQTPS